MSEHRDALERIVILCEQSSQYSRRLQNVHEIAMTALGMTKNQRVERHIKAVTYSCDVQKISKALGKSFAKKEIGYKKPRDILKEIGEQEHE